MTASLCEPNRTVVHRLVLYQFGLMAAALPVSGLYWFTFYRDKAVYS